MFEIGQKLDLINLYDQQIKESRQALNILLSAYRNSAKEFEEVLRMEQQLLKYQKMKATAISQLQIAFERLKYITAERTNLEDIQN